MLLAVIATIFFGLLRLVAGDAVRHGLPAPYGAVAVHIAGLGLFVSLAILLDRLIRALYWNRYLKRRRGMATPALMEDLLTIALVVLGISLGLYWEEGVSITGLVTASGATAIILGIALQAVIQDLFSGLAVNIEGAYAIGDWLTFYSEQMHEAGFGRVTGITWRNTFLMQEDGRTLMVPNHMMTTHPVLNHNRPPGPKRFEVEISADNRIPFRRLHDALLGEAYKVVTHPGFARHPKPSVMLHRIGEDGCYYLVRFYAWPGQISTTRCRSAMLAALQEAVLQNDFASPVQQIEIQPPPRLDFTLGEKETRAVLRRAPLFARTLDEKQVADLATHCHVHDFSASTVLMRQGDPPGPMYIILEGAISIAIVGPDGQDHEVAVSATGDAVGEMSLMTGAPRSATATTLCHVRALEIGKDGIEALLAKTPRLAERLSEVLAERQRALQAAVDQHARKEDGARDILTRMLDFFGQALGVSG